MLPRTMFYGDYDVGVKVERVGGYVCDVSQTALIARPVGAGDKKFPLLSSAHGHALGGQGLLILGDWLSQIASSGYIVIANMSADTDVCDESHDQLRSIEWFKQHEQYSQLVDWNTKVGVLGYSMGAESTQVTADNAKAIKDHNIGAAAVMHGKYMWITEGRPTSAKLPVIYWGGSDDTVTPAAHQEKYYHQVEQGQPKVFAVTRNGLWPAADHLTPAHFKLTPELPYTISFFNCHLLGDKLGCAHVYGDGHSSIRSLCSSPDYLPTTQCEFENPPVVPSNLEIPEELPGWIKISQSAPSEEEIKGYAVIITDFYERFMKFMIGNDIMQKQDAANQSFAACMRFESAAFCSSSSSNQRKGVEKADTQPERKAEAEATETTEA